MVMGSFKLADISSKPPKKLDKSPIKEKIRNLDEKIGEWQNILYAEGKHSLLIVLQGMDASGKDGSIRHVFNAVNPQGVVVRGFKSPTPDEASHDFLWRIHAHTPARGMIQIFNRSHYEDVLITRVHGWIDDKTAHKRMDAINNFERLLEQNHTHILKFYLHISKEEQNKRLNERLLDPRKRWKYSPNDIKERQKWHDYLYYYEEVFEKCSRDIPWIIVPSDDNWYKEYLIANTVESALRNMKLHYPRHIRKS